MKPSIYVASKTKHAPMWRQYRSEGYNIISTWIDEAEVGQTKSFSDLWDRCIRESHTADILIIYRNEGEVLKGAFAELGSCLANNNTSKYVLAIGCEDLSFTAHRKVLLAKDLDSAFHLIDLKERWKNHNWYLCTWCNCALNTTQSFDWCPNCKWYEPLPSKPEVEAEKYIISKRYA